jgi:UDP-GlcNAc:undecaprenyl-phosphate/decaprenyl-phosphate GlcNAc-1-phosphate transferase
MTIIEFTGAMIVAFFISFTGMPTLIKVSHLKQLVDKPEEDRKKHSVSTPSMGGIIIFGAFLFSYMLIFPNNAPESDIAIMKSMIGALVILFFIGVKDDIIGTAPTKKLISQIVAVLLIIFVGGIRIRGMHGVFGVEEAFPEWASVGITIFVLIVIINAYNLIDGVDGLAAGIGCINAILFGIFFLLTGQDSLALISFSLFGSLVGFLVYNFHPAKVFMGDSGSLVIGVIIGVLAVLMIETPNSSIPDYYNNINTPVLAMCILCYPLIDTIRVFVIRTFRGISPFTADRNHIHYVLKDAGYSDKQTVVSIYLYTFFIVSIPLILFNYSSTISFLVSISTALIIILIMLFVVKRKRLSK